MSINGLEFLPYGKWTCANGREVLFNRSYEPLFSRINGVVSKANRREWVEGIVRHEHYYDDFRSPRHNVRTRRVCRNVLAEWGIDPATGEPLRSASSADRSDINELVDCVHAAISSFAERRGFMGMSKHGAFDFYSACERAIEREMRRAKKAAAIERAAG